MNEKTLLRSIIVFGTSIGYVVDSYDDRYILGAYDIDFNGNGHKIRINSFDVSAMAKGLRLATDEEAELFRRHLFQAGYGISAYGMKIVKVPRVSPGDFVIVDSQMRGVVDSVTEDCMKLSVFAYEAGMLEMDMKPWDHCFELMKKLDVRYFIADLKSYGFSWDFTNIKAVKMKPRAPVNGRYWHITDRFTIRMEEDTRTPKHNQRYDAGNYFVEYEDAVEAINVLLVHIGSCPIRIQGHDNHDLPDTDQE